MIIFSNFFTARLIICSYTETSVYILLVMQYSGLDVSYCKTPFLFPWSSFVYILSFNVLYYDGRRIYVSYNYYYNNIVH